MYARYGIPVAFLSTGGHPEYHEVTDEPENIKAVLATQFGEFGKGPQFHEVWKDFLGESIFNGMVARRENNGLRLNILH